MPVSKNYQALIQYNISTGGTVFKGSGECWGYAEKVRRLFGSGGRKTSVKKRNTGTNLYNTLKNVRPGTHVRFGNSKTGDGRHSIAVYKVTKDKLYFSDANVISKNGIRHMEVGIDFFSQKYDYIMWYIQPTGSYKVRSTKLAGFSYDLTDRIELAWKPVSGAKKYTIYRASSKNGKYTKLTTVKSPLYTDKDPLKGANYYKVKPNNRSMTSAKVIYNKITPPTIHVNATAKGYSKLTWDKIKGAKKYGVYKYTYSKKKGYYYKLLKKVSGNSYTYKGSADEELYVKALASPSGSDSAYNRAEVYRFAPKAKIYGYEPIEGEENSYSFDVGALYKSDSFDYLYFSLYRSENKNGPYIQVWGSFMYNDDEDYKNIYGPVETPYTRDTYNYKTSRLKLEDYGLEYGKTYYYKASAVGGETAWSQMNGLDSAVFKIKTPDISASEKATPFGGGTLYKLADGTLSRFVDPDGNEYTKGLYLEKFYEGYLNFEDDSGIEYTLYENGDLYMTEPGSSRVRVKTFEVNESNDDN